MIKFTLNQWNLKIIEDELINRGLKPSIDFDFLWEDIDSSGWRICFRNEKDALIWRLEHGHKWL